MAKKALPGKPALSKSPAARMYWRGEEPSHTLAEAKKYADRLLSTSRGPVKASS